MPQVRANSRARARACPRASDRAELRTGALLLVVFCCGAAALSLAAGAGGSSVVMFCGLAALYGLAGLVEFEVGSVYTDCSLPVLTAMFILLPASLPHGASRPVRRSARRSRPAGARAMSRGWFRRSPSARCRYSRPPPCSRHRRRSPRGRTRRRSPPPWVPTSPPTSRSRWSSRGSPTASRSRFPRWRRHGSTASTCCWRRVGVAMAIAAEGRLWAVAVVFLPLAVLLRVFANERRSRIDHALELSQRVPRHRDAPRRHGREPTTPTPARTVATSSSSPSRSARRMGLERRAPARPGVRRPAARRRQDRRPQGDHQQARHADPRRVGDHEAPHDRRPADARERRWRALARRRDRARLPRELRRQRISRTGSPATRSRSRRGSARLAMPSAQ